jgi:hypothetical protein
MQQADRERSVLLSAIFTRVVTGRSRQQSMYRVVVGSEFTGLALQGYRRRQNRQQSVFVRAISWKRAVDLAAHFSSADSNKSKPGSFEEPRVYGALEIGRRNMPPESDPPDSRSNTARMSRHADDAHTVEDAIYWHIKIITELTMEATAVDRKSWPLAVKTATLFSLQQRAEHHHVMVARLNRVIEENDQFIWQP